MSPMDCVTTFLQLMGESRLEDAGRFVGKMKKPQRKEIQSLIADLDPAALTAPVLRDVPPPVLKIFLTQMERQLR